jgi:hypothetical protein
VAPPPPDIELHFVTRPGALPAPPREGRVVVLDVAFAYTDAFETSTLAYLEALGPRLALWADHHDHPRWSTYQGRPGFVLVSKLTARACPELLTPEVVQVAGPVQHVVAHADFDGCMSAAKFLRGGVEPYPGADEDARFADAPGHGFVCSASGLRLVRAVEEAGEGLDEAAYAALLASLARALASGSEAAALTVALDGWAQGAAARAARLEPHLSRVTRPHPEVALLKIPSSVTNVDKKVLLRRMEEAARVAVLQQGGHVTVATFDDAGDVDLSSIRGLRGQRGFAWGKADLAVVLRSIVAML